MRSRVQVRLEDGPAVPSWSVFLEKRCWVQTRRRGAGTGLEVGNVLFLQFRIGAIAEPPQVTADQRLPCVPQGHIVRAYPAGDVLRNGEALERNPARHHHIHEHQGVVLRRVDEDVVGCVIWSVEREVQLLAADVQNVPLVERHARWWTLRIVVAEQQTAILAMSDAYHIRTEQRGRSNVVRVRVRVDQVRDFGWHAAGMRHRFDRAQQVVTYGGWRIDQDHAFSGGQKHRLIDRVGHPVQVAVDLANEITVGVERGAERLGGDGCEIGQVVGVCGTRHASQWAAKQCRGGGSKSRRDRGGEERATPCARRVGLDGHAQWLLEARVARERRRWFLSHGFKWLRCWSRATRSHVLTKSASFYRHAVTLRLFMDRWRAAHAQAGAAAV